MINYEILLLTVPEITVDEASVIETQIDKAVRDQGVKILSYERWGKMLLAYPVRNNDYGVYFLARFSVAQGEQGRALLEQLKNLAMVRYSDTIMRHMIDRLDPRLPLTYQRPESLEEVSTRRESSDKFSQAPQEGRSYGQES